ncbi:hypothetical protein SEPCBS119000_005553 [Sporothrix epigloea]|uniref:Uncharacterized protein n=1 Tax=Sporothrix epigloea TaxID=1892477 RepID=A0ABP0DYH0_9PEZI
MNAASDPINQYGLSHGYAVMPDPYDSYRWQAYEQERVRRQTLEAVAQQQAGLAAVLSDMLGSDPSSSATLYPTSYLQPTHSWSLCCCEDEDDDDDDSRRRKKKKKCKGSECRRKTLSFQRAGPHWCDGRSWGGKIWGMTRSPGDKNRSNWRGYVDPAIGKREEDALCRWYHHHDEANYVTVCDSCQGHGYLEWSPGYYDDAYNTAANDIDAYYGSFGASRLPNMPPHRGYSGHPAGNVEQWRVRDHKAASKKSSSSSSSSSSDD